jgi:hypothetical protein
MGVGFRNIYPGCAQNGYSDLGLWTALNLSRRQMHGRSHYVGYLHWQRRARLLLLTLGGYSNLVPHGQYLSLLLPILGFFLRPFQAKDL